MMKLVRRTINWKLIWNDAIQYLTVAVVILMIGAIGFGPLFIAMAYHMDAVAGVVSFIWALGFITGSVMFYLERDRIIARYTEYCDFNENKVGNDVLRR